MSIDGFLEVGTNEAHDVVINLPRDRTGHIVFTPRQGTPARRHLESEGPTMPIRARREAEEERRRATTPPVDRTKLCTTSGESVEDVRRNQTEKTGQHKSYIVLCDEEHARKGSCVPYRDTYKHLTCGTTTTMGRKIAETYARDPEFYGETFCVNCNAHFRLSEFVWLDGSQVGS